MPPTPDLLKPFLWRLLLWLPLSFGIWYYFSVMMTVPLRWLVDGLMLSLGGGLIAGVSQQGYELSVLTNLHPIAGTPGAGGQIVFKLNPLMYGYSLPLFTALCLATPTAEGDKWWRWLIGIGVLLLVQALGVGLHILKTTVLGLGPSLGGQIDPKEWNLNAIALGYQFGYLVLPAVTPLVLWLGLFRGFVLGLAPGFGRRG